MTFKGSSVRLKSRPLWLAELAWVSSTQCQDYASIKWGGSEKSQHAMKLRKDWEINNDVDGILQPCWFVHPQYLALPVRFQTECACCSKVWPLVIGSHVTQTADFISQLLMVDTQKRHILKEIVLSKPSLAVCSNFRNISLFWISLLTQVTSTLHWIYLPILWQTYLPLQQKSGSVSTYHRLGCGKEGDSWLYSQNQTALPF